MYARADVEEDVDSARKNCLGRMEEALGIVDRSGNVISHGSISTTQFDEFKDYFMNTFPKALAKVKEIAEQ